MTGPTKYWTLLRALQSAQREMSLAIDKVRTLSEEDLGWGVVGEAMKLQMDVDYATRVIIGYGEPTPAPDPTCATREDVLYWNREGLVRCWRHCPPKGCSEWRGDRWRVLTRIEMEDLLDSKGVLPACTRCGKGPVLESLNRRNGEPPQTVRDLALRPHATGRKSSTRATPK